MNANERRIRLRLKSDFALYAEKCLSIRSKTGRIVPFRMNSAQKIIHAALERQLKETGRIRALILKGRQQGCSTYVAGRFFWKVTHHRGMRAFVLTHLEDATQNLFQIMRRFYEHCPLPLRPEVSEKNSRAMTFGRLDSGFLVGTARSEGVGRSSTLQYFHGSEVAYWPKADEHMSGILQAVTAEEGSEVVLESTSAGRTGLFYGMCARAIQGQSSYQIIFVPWFLQEEYKILSLPDDEVTADEKAYAEKHGLSKEQIFWRRQKIMELGGVDRFQREYPATVEEAFEVERKGALWRRQTIEKNRILKENIPNLRRVVVSIDPATSAAKESDETGIIVAGVGEDGHGYVLADLSGRYMPAEWARRAIDAYHDYKADRIVAETNQGGDMVEHTLRSLDRAVAYKSEHKRCLL